MLAGMGKPGRWIVAGLTGAFAVALAGIVAAQSGDGSGSTANVEVRVWQSVADAGSLYVSAREGRAVRGATSAPCPST